MCPRVVTSTRNVYKQSVEAEMSRKQNAEVDFDPGHMFVNMVRTGGNKERSGVLRGVLSYRMDRMIERLDEHADHLDTADHRISDVEHECANKVAMQSKVDKTHNALQAKIEDLEARS
ncbi:hypothetical protein NDU88_001613 [Pleurodeles waltl]|uniref:Uncharacterized protein n=1 Tax=Pleurodeles waltl TaxID=8319 RepID=A0AAV7LZT5_PLEWA|nr:hypothetical protein NDU88_001613 [Pleurodeles waltl]